MTGLKQGKIQKFVVAQFRRVETNGDAVETWACNKEASTEQKLQHGQCQKHFRNICLIITTLN